MFYYLEGKITVMNQNTAVIDCHGIGFLCNVSLNTMSHLELDKVFRIYTYCHIKEDGFDIFGFYDLTEKRSFEMLLGVSGIGPKAALSILSAVTPEGLALAVMNSDEKMITAAQGIGKKIAQRVILELKDKMAKESVNMTQGGNSTSIPAAVTGNSKYSDACAALTVLGFAPAEASAILKQINIDALTLEEIIKEALKKSN